MYLLPTGMGYAHFNASNQFSFHFDALLLNLQLAEYYFHALMNAST
ncbi:hypothetical protein [Pseudocnuella soli]|nr:hypothetical protein [Pseudocnuella soli]